MTPDELKASLHAMLSPDWKGPDDDGFEADPVALAAALAATLARNARLVALVRRLEYGHRRITDNGRTLFECHHCGGVDPQLWCDWMHVSGYEKGHLQICPVAAEIAELCGEE